MKLFLTSAAVKTLDKIVPLLPKSPIDTVVAFIPTAGDPYKKMPWIDEDREKLIELGFTVFDLDLKEKNETQVRDALKGTDIIFVAGGNTFYLLEKARKSGFEKVVKELVTGDVIYIGSSAGSVVVGPDIEAVQDFDDPTDAQLDSTIGFGLVDFVVLPHFKKEKSEIYEMVMAEYENKYTFLLLTDTQFVLVTDKNYKIIG